MPSHQLYLMTLGELVFPDPAKGEPDRVPIMSYLIRSAKGRTILIDTGAPKKLVGADRSNPWIPNTGVSVREEDDVVAHIAKLGMRPKDVDLLISSHFDFDSCGRHDAFAAANVPVIVQKDHYEYARSHPDRYDPSLFQFDGWSYDVVDGDTELERGIAVIKTSGHATGHQSVYVETANGPVVLTLDAIMWPAQAQTREFPSWYDDAGEASKSIDKLMQFALDYRAYTIYGHDPGQIDTLPHAPRAFSR